MMRFAATSYVAARPRDVFAVVGDPKRLGEWLTNVDDVVDDRVGPAVDEGPGAFHLTAKVEDAPVLVEGHTAVWGPQHRVGFEFTSEVGHWELDYMIRPAGANTRLDVILVATRASWLKALLLRTRARHARQEFAAALTRLRELIEAGEARSSEGPSSN
jgi:hypothetical protein